MKSSDIIIKLDNRKEVTQALEKQILKGLEECGLKAEAYAKALTPVDTGMLRNSITHEVVPNEKACYIGSNLEYAPYVEFGTGIYYGGGRKTPWVYEDSKGDWHMTNGQRAQPYLKPAVSDHTDEWNRIIKSNLSN